MIKNFETHSLKNKPINGEDILSEVTHSDLKVPFSFREATTNPYLETLSVFFMRLGPHDRKHDHLGQ